MVLTPLLSSLTMRGETDTDRQTAKDRQRQSEGDMGVRGMNTCLAIMCLSPMSPHSHIPLHCPHSLLTSGGAGLIGGLDAGVP